MRSALRLPAKHEDRPRWVGKSTALVTHVHKDSASRVQHMADLDEIEGIVRPLDPTLVKLYFRIVHPTFPVLNKDAFLQKYTRSYHEISPPLLAGVYLLALEWQLFDRALLDAPRTPDTALLEDVGTRAMQADLKRPKLSTLQAGLLLLQRVRRTNNTLLAQLIAVGQALGIHADCSDWSIPAWEKGLRRRLAWALYMQDKWGSLVYGRPSLISDRITPGTENDETDWDVRPCRVNDSAETSTDPEDVSCQSVDMQTGRSSFLHAIELAKIFSQLKYTFCSAGATKKGGGIDCLSTIQTVELADSFALQLQQWYTSLPDCLRLHTTTPARRLSANGALHLSHMAAEITLHRALLRALKPDTPSHLRSSIRTQARSRLLSALQLIESLQSEHTQSFWGFAAPAQLAMIGSFAGLLWATSADGDEAIEYVNQVERLRWALQVRGSAVPFVCEALRMLDEEVGHLDVVKIEASAVKVEA